MRFDDVVVDSEVGYLLKNAFVFTNDDAYVSRIFNKGTIVEVFGKIDTRLSPGFECCLVEVIDEMGTQYNAIVGSACLEKL